VGHAKNLGGGHISGGLSDAALPDRVDGIIVHSVQSVFVIAIVLTLVLK
jgi:hypothetical protein